MSQIRNAVTSNGLVGLAALHDLNLAAQFCDRVVLIKDGQIKADGSPESVLGSPDIDDAYGVSTELGRTGSGRLFVDATLGDIPAKRVA